MYLLRETGQVSLAKLADGQCLSEWYVGCDDVPKPDRSSELLEVDDEVYLNFITSVPIGLKN